MKALQNSHKLTLFTKIQYGSGQGVDAAIQVGLNTFLLYYLTVVCGFSGSSAGLIFFMSLMIDALLDPLIGRMSDRVWSRWGRRLPFMLVALLPMAGSAVAIFSMPKGLGEASTFFYVLLFNVTLRIGLSIFALPHAALTAELSNDYRERSAISGFRALFMFLGTLACLLPGSMVILSGDKLQSPEAYRSFGIWLAFLVLLFGASCLIGIWRVVLALPAPQYEEEPPTFITDIANLTRNRSFVRLFLAAILILVGQGLTLALNIHAFRFFWLIPADQTQLPLMLLVLGQAIGLPIAVVFARLAEKRDRMMFAVVFTGIYTLAMTLVASAGLLPVGTRLSLGLVLMNAIILGISSTIFIVCLFSMMADAVDEHDYMFGTKREALYAAALLLGAKAATGIGGFIAGVGLELIGFSNAAGEADPLSGGTPLPSAEAIDNLGVLWGVVPPLLLLLSLPLLFGYAISKKRHAFIIEQLGARGANGGGGPPVVAPS